MHTSKILILLSYITWEKAWLDPNDQLYQTCIIFLLGQITVWPNNWGPNYSRPNNWRPNYWQAFLQVYQIDLFTCPSLSRAILLITVWNKRPCIIVFEDWVFDNQKYCVKPTYVWISVTIFWYAMQNYIHKSVNP